MVGVPDFVYWTNLFLVGFTTKAILMVMAWVSRSWPLYSLNVQQDEDTSYIYLIIQGVRKLTYTTTRRDLSSFRGSCVNFRILCIYCY